MKKGEVYEGIAESIRFPNKTVVKTGEETVIVKNVLPGQKISYRLSRKKGGHMEGTLQRVLEKSPLELEQPACRWSGQCGGCLYQTLPYEEELKIKKEQVLNLLSEVVPDAAALFEDIFTGPSRFGYRNKMEFTFGDEYKDGPLAVGMHKRGAFYDIVPVVGCRIADEDFSRILKITRDYFAGKKIPYYHRMRHTGYLRHLLVRKAVHTGEILIDLITTGQTECLPAESEESVLRGWKEALLLAETDGIITGILHTRNDSLADAVIDQGTEILYGKDYFYETLLGLSFKITPFSFFQTNSPGAEVLYTKVRDFIGDTLQNGQQTVFDLYSGTGTIAQMLAPAAGRVVGVEIVEEAVEAARENAARNHLDNCTFLAGDVLKVLDHISERPDFIVLDPPRDGIHPKALDKIIDYGVSRMIYVSCKPTSLQRDLKILTARGYQVKRLCCVDMFCGSPNVETCVLLEHRK